MQVPRLEEGLPVDVLRDLRQVKILEQPAANELGLARHIAVPVDRRLVGARLFQRDQRRGLAVGVLLAHPRVFHLEVVQEGVGRFGHQVLRDPDRARCVGHVDDRAFVMRRDLDRRVHTAGGGAADQ